MGWKDTVMMPEQTRAKRKQLFPHGHKDCFECEQFVRDAQAEISFKAGEERGYVQGFDAAESTMVPRATENGRLAGIKVVVEFINNLIIGIDGCKFGERLNGDKGCIVLDMNEDQWQAQLKDWGL